MTTSDADPRDGVGAVLVVALIEWQAPEMTRVEADEVARRSCAVLNEAPGLLDARFFGDFESGTHCFLLTWRNREAMDRYMASESMRSVRGAAAPFVTSTPSRRIFAEYGPVAVGTDRTDE